MGKNIAIVALIVLLGASKYFDHLTTIHSMDDELVVLRLNQEKLKAISLHFIGGSTQTELESLLTELFPTSRTVTKDGQIRSAFLTFQLGADDRVVSIAQ